MQHRQTMFCNKLGFQDSLFREGHSHVDSRMPSTASLTAA